MMKRRRTPQEKKQLSYQKDCRNSYRENSKASRKAIPFRRRNVHKSYRKAIKQNLSVSLSSQTDIDTIIQVDLQVKEVKRKRWRKSPDTPLGNYIHRQQNVWKRRIYNGSLISDDEDLDTLH